MLIKGDKIVTVTDPQAPAAEYILSGVLTAATTTDVAAVIKLQNPAGADLIITDMIVDVTTKSTGAATLDIGVDDAADTSNDTLFDGLDVGTAAGLFNTYKNAGTNGKMNVVWKKDEYVVATASASVAGIVGKYRIRAITR